MLDDHTGAASPFGSVTLCLLDGPYLAIAHSVTQVGPDVGRTLALAALSQTPLTYHDAAMVLWPDDAAPVERLRKALRTLRGSGLEVVSSVQGSLRLRDSVQVDLRRLLDWARRVVRPTVDPADLHPVRLTAQSLLPGWQDDWVESHRHRLHVALLPALEAQSRGLSETGRHTEAVEVAAVVVAAEPLRERARAALITAYLASGDREAAKFALADYRQRLERELGISPSKELIALVRSGGRSRSRTRGHLRVVG